MPLNHLRNAVILAAFLVFGTACGAVDADDPEATPEGQCAYPAAPPAAAKPVDRPSPDPDPDAPTKATIATSAGDISITLEPDAAPCTVNSFLSLVEQDWYDDTKCHRLTTSGIWILQCGDPTETGSGGPGYAIADELIDADSRLQPCATTGGGPICTYPAGAVAMANRGPDTSGSQFFLVYRPSKLPPNYTLFGHLDAGSLAVVRKIAAAGTTNGPEAAEGLPAEPVEITDVITD